MFGFIEYFWLSYLEAFISPQVSADEEYDTIYDEEIIKGEYTAYNHEQALQDNDWRRHWQTSKQVADIVAVHKEEDPDEQYQR